MKKATSTGSLQALVLAAVLGVILANGLGAQAERIPYVDIAEARREIAILDEQIATYTREVQTLEAEHEKLRSEYQTTQEGLKATTDAFEEARNQRFRMEQTLSAIVDRETKARIAESIKKINEAIAAGGLSMSAGNRNQRDLFEKLKASQARIDTTQTILSRKKDRKAFLQAAIEKTQKQIDAFTQQINAFESFFSSTEAQRLRVQPNL